MIRSVLTGKFGLKRKAPRSCLAMKRCVSRRSYSSLPFTLPKAVIGAWFPVSLNRPPSRQGMRFTFALVRAAMPGSTCQARYAFGLPKSKIKSIVLLMSWPSPVLCPGTQVQLVCPCRALLSMQPDVVGGDLVGLEDPVIG